MVAYRNIVLLLSAQSARCTQDKQFPGQQLDAMSSQLYRPYSYPQVAPAQNLLRPLQRLPLMQEVQQQQPMQQPLRLTQQQLQQRKEDENARLWREAEEEERLDEEKEQQAAMQIKKQQQLMQLRQQEQAHPTPAAAESSGMWTKIQAAMQGVSLQLLYNMVLFVIAGSAVAFSLTKTNGFSLQLPRASVLNPDKAVTKADVSNNPESLVDEAPSEQAEDDPQIPVALAEAEETVAPQPPVSTNTKGAAHVPRPPAQRVTQSSNKGTPLYLCEATGVQIHKYDGLEALQKALKTRSHNVAQGNNCIVLAGNPGKEAATCAQQ